MNPEFVHLEADHLDECPKCHRVLTVGDFPFCPHGRGGYIAVPDDIPGGQWQENGLPEPEKFYSKKARDRRLAEFGNEIRPWWVPNDKVLTRWDSVDLEGAAALVSRRQKAYKDEVPPAPPALIQALKKEFYR